MSTPQLCIRSSRKTKSVILSHASLLAQVQAQVDSLLSRFHALKDGAEARRANLEDALFYVKEYHDKVEPLMKWLDASEKLPRITGLQPIATSFYAIMV